MIHCLLFPVFCFSWHILDYLLRVGVSDQCEFDPGSQKAVQARIIMMEAFLDISMSSMRERPSKDVPSGPMMDSAFGNVVTAGLDETR
jgi:hypothetical protein